MLGLEPKAAKAWVTVLTCETMAGSTRVWRVGLVGTRPVLRWDLEPIAQLAKKYGYPNEKICAQRRAKPLIL